MASDNEDPKVSVFGRDFQAEKWEYEVSQRVGWGIFLIFAGAIFLLNTFDVLPWNIWQDVVRFWPFLLILSGLQIILGSGVLSRLLLSLAALSVFALIFLSVLQGPYPDLLTSFPVSVQRLVEYITGINQ